MTASFGAQANALLRKSATYQKRNVRTNICLLSSPIFFCFILLIIKVLINKVFLSGPDYECGCKCMRCCRNDQDCQELQQGYCDEDLGYECKRYDKEKCGLAYSSPSQSSWCEVKEPSSWPPVVQVPKWWRRAKPGRPGVTQLLTAPSGPTSFSSADLYGHLYTTPAPMDSTAFLAFLDKLITVNGTVNGYLFAKAGFTFGTAAPGGQQKFIESAFSSETGLDLLLPNVDGLSCAALGVNFEDLARQSGLVQQPTPSNATRAAARLIDVLVAFVAFSSGTTVTEAQVLEVLGTRPVLAGFLTRATSCTDVLMAPAATSDAIDNLIYCGFYQARCNGTPVTSEYPPALEFSAASAASLSLSVLYNDTDADGGGGPGNYLRVQRSLSGSVSAWWANVVGSASALADDVQLLGIMSMPKASSRLKLDFSNLLGPLFYTWVVQMLLPTFLQQLVYEKEKRLRMMMKMHGLGDGAYWLITYLWFLMLYIIYILIFILFGAGVGLEIFRRTSMGVQAVFYFLFGNNMIAFAFMLSSLFSSSKTSTVVAFIYVFATGLIGELLLKVFMQKDASWVFFIEWIPAFSLYRGLWEMAEYAFLGVYQDKAGLTMSTLSDPGNGMRATWAILAVEWIVFMVVGWYLEQVLSSGTGIRRRPLFFLDWCLPKRPQQQLVASPRASIELGSGHHVGAKAGGGGSVKLAPGEREDVRAERLRVEGLSPAEADATPILVRDLRKVYPPLDGGKPKLAVRTLTLGIERGECFGLLGPNGAGKSTAINMLTGFLEPSGGAASIEGRDIFTEMDSIYRVMGVCPQHDLLWEQLTGEEHLLFYGRLKGLKGPELLGAVGSGLKSVNLANGGVGQKQSQKYSGGMKRRLSVAISFIGNPQVVYLDEPSTGLDPASRRNLWDVVRRNKDGRAIILTTHSMEEAQVLCDRLGIFVDGQLVCIGNPREITARYAGYFVFTLTVGQGHEEAAKAFVAHMSPNCRLTYALGSTVKYELPTEDVTLSGVFDAMATAKTQMQVLDWGVANATLEEVFIKFARQIGAESNEQ